MRCWGSRGWARGASWRRRGRKPLEVPFRERAARTGFQVFFECDGELFVAERKISPYPPRSVLRRMAHFPSIMLRPTGFQIIGDSDVEMFGIETFKDVDVFHRVPPDGRIHEQFIEARIGLPR